MKFAVISDIHGNMEALDAVLEKIKKERVDRIFVLGDYAMAGPEPDVMLNWIMQNSEKEKMTLIQGNTDLMIATYTEELYRNLSEKAPIMAEALKDDYFLINPVQREFLRSLPPQLEIMEEGVRILFVHGSPRANNEDILPTTPLAEVERMIANTTADVVLCGHTHIPCGFQTSQKRTVVNVGSVGRPFTPEPKSCYLIMTVSKGRCVFEHKFVKYNNERAAMKLRGRKFNGVNILANSLLDPKLRHF